MKKLIKKITAMILAGVMAANMGAAAFAEFDNETVTENVQSDFILNNIRAHLSLYYGEASDKYYIGTEIPSYAVKGDKFVASKDTSYYPIYRESKPVGTFSIHTNSNGGLTFSYSEELFDRKTVLDIHN